MASSKYEKQSESYINPLRKEALADRKSLYKTEKGDINEIYDKQVFNESKAYEDQYRENAVQKAINERQVAESMANLGLTDSGLNRTQQTAVQLSYANNNAAIDRQKRSAIDSYELARTQDLSSAKRTYLADKASINQQYDQLQADYAQSLNDSALSAAAKITAQEENKKVTNIINSKNGVLNREFTGSLEKNGVSVESYTDEGIEYVKYIDRVTGYESVFRRGTNPYTNTVNENVKYGTFDNGYQPNNMGKDKPLKLADAMAFNINGQTQNVFKCDGKYYVWDGTENDYFEVKKVMVNRLEYYWEEAK